MYALGVRIHVYVCVYVRIYVCEYVHVWMCIHTLCTEPPEDAGGAQGEARQRVVLTLLTLLTLGAHTEPPEDAGGAQGEARQRAAGGGACC